MKTPPNNACSGLGGTRRARAAVSAKAFFRFGGWSPHQAANASRWAVPCMAESIMKTKTVVAVLLIVIFLAACTPEVVAVPLTSTSQTEVEASESITSDWNIYTSKLFLVSLKYPADWEIDHEGNAVYSGKDGFFQLSASSMSGLTAKEMCENDIQINNSGKENDYGTNPTMEILQVDNQPACLVLPADDQPQYKRGSSLLVVEYPALEGGRTRLLQFIADKNHIRDLIGTLKFVR